MGKTEVFQPGARAGAKLDPITVEVVRHKLEGIANEMESTLLRSSFSPIVKEGMDASASLFTMRGEALAQACAVPIHLATLIPVVETFIREFPLDTMQDGDIYIMNDPYLGGTHLPDIALVTPIFHRGQVLALSATMTHHQDVGGMTPGSIPTNATEIFQEGIRIPPLKLRDAGTMNDTLVKMLRLNVRIPDTLMGDLNAQIAGCQIGARRLAATSSCGLCGKESLDDVLRDVVPVTRNIPIDAVRLQAIHGAMRQKQSTFSGTGGSHAAAAATAAGEILAVFEDVGRHNAVDKVVGFLLEQGLLPRADVLAVSGRVSFEIVQKCARAGLPVLSAISAPSSLAVECAHRWGITLAGFCRGDRATFYSGLGRVERSGG